MTKRQNGKQFYEGQVKLNGEFITYHKIDHDNSGNPRYVIHFLEMDVKYDDPRLNEVGFKRYRAKWYGGGLVMQSYALEDELQRAYDRLHPEIVEFKEFVSVTIDNMKNGNWSAKIAKGLIKEAQRQLCEQGFDSYTLSKLMKTALLNIDTMTKGVA